MALDLQGFVAPVSNYEGLYKVGDDLQKNRLREEKEKQDDAANQMASSKYLQNSLGKNQLFTGTPFDPVNNHLVGTAMSQALEMIKNKVPLQNVQLAIQPLVDQMSDYSTKAKDYQIQKKSVLANARGIKGIDQAALSAEMDKTAFPVDPKTGIPDISNYNPNTDYGSMALKGGEDIYTNDALPDFKSKAGIIKRIDNIKRYNSQGGMYNTGADLSYRSYMKPEVDSKGVTVGFVPKYDVATDENNDLIHSFGEQGDHPVRMVKDNIFDSLPKTSQAYYLQEVRKHTRGAKTPLDLETSKMIAKAYAYDDLNDQSSYTIKNISAQKENPVDKYYAHRDYAVAHPLPTHSAAAANNNNNRNGISYDEIGSTHPVQGFTLQKSNSKFPFPFASPTQVPIKIESGVVYDNNGDKFSGEVNIDKKDFPANSIAALNKNNFNTENSIKATVKDGQIQSIETRNGTVDRNAMQNFQQDIQIKNKVVPQKEFGKEAPALKTNKEPKKTTTTKKVGELNDL